MRRIVFGLLLVPLIACSDVLADDVQAPNANSGGSQQVQANKKLRSEQVSRPSPIDGAKNRKSTSMTRSRAPAALPLSSAETYATSRFHLPPNRRRRRVIHGPAFTSGLASAPSLSSSALEIESAQGVHLPRRSA
jgi:hypothetical protein